MNRQKAREEAFLMLCESAFGPERTADEIYDTAMIARDLEEDTFARACVRGVCENREQIDAMISSHASGWSRRRLSVVTGAILQLATYEMMFRQDIPLRVSLNEAIELAKRYDDEKARAFVNGVLNAIATEARATRSDEE